ncbi:hypothetical protein MHH93_09355 [Priestia sp. FSL H7-0729]
MAEINKRLAKGFTIASSIVIYTVPAGTTTFVKSLTLCNTNASEAEFNMILAGTKIISNYILKSSSTVTIPYIDQILHSGETIQVSSNSSGSSINFYISGKEVTS